MDFHLLVVSESAMIRIHGHTMDHAVFSSMNKVITVNSMIFVGKKMMFVVVELKSMEIKRILNIG
jgi:hypothetical protein